MEISTNIIDANGVRPIKISWYSWQITLRVLFLKLLTCKVESKIYFTIHVFLLLKRFNLFNEKNSLSTEIIDRFLQKFEICESCPSICVFPHHLIESLPSNSNSCVISVIISCTHSRTLLMTSLEYVQRCSYMKSWTKLKNFSSHKFLLYDMSTRDSSNTWPLAHL